MEEARIRKVIAKPFGPYEDKVILDKKCNTTTRESVVLSSLMMACNDQAIGFDESEDSSHSDPTARVNHYPICFRGVIEIKSLDWLSPRGRKYLEYEVKKRDIDMRIHTSNNPTSDLTLERIYRRDPVFKATGGMTITVLIQGEKSMSALFMTSDVLPNGLLFSSMHDHRRYEVTSLDVETHNLSENFFMRYRLVALMQAIIASDPEKTEVEERTINYFVDAYLARFTVGYERINLFRRLISDPDDLDVDWEGKCKRQRHLRPVHRSEVIGVFASQAEWILVDQLNRKEKNFLDIKSWSQFCKQVKVGRREAKRSKKQWGLAFGEDSDAEDTDDDIDYGRVGLTGPKLEEIKRALIRKTTRKSKRKSKAKSKGKQRAIEPIPPSEPDEDYVMQTNIYDSDFSEASSPPASASSDDNSDEENPEIANLISPVFWNVPQLPGIDFQWHCPVEDCAFNLNMLNLSADDLRGMSPNMANFLRSKKWKKLTDPQVIAGFYELVSGHYDNHMAELDIMWQNRGEKKGKLIWINPRRHAAWPPPKSKSRRQRYDEIVKQEEDDIAILTGTGSGSRLRPR